MSARNTPELDIRGRQEWRRWLRRNHANVDAVWLVFHKSHTGVSCMEYDDAVEEALCFGWVDSLIRRLDDDRFARKFTPRKPDSRWSTINRKRYAKLKSQGLLEAPGLARAPTNRDGDAPKVPDLSPPMDLRKVLDGNAAASARFDALSPSYKRGILGWIGSAKRDETRQKRILQAVEILASGRKLGLK